MKHLIRRIYQFIEHLLRHTILKRSTMQRIKHPVNDRIRPIYRRRRLSIFPSPVRAGIACKIPFLVRQRHQHGLEYSHTLTYFPSCALLDNIFKYIRSFIRLSLHRFVNS